MAPSGKAGEAIIKKEWYDIKYFRMGYRPVIEIAKEKRGMDYNGS